MACYVGTITMQLGTFLSKGELMITIEKPKMVTTMGEGTDLD